MVRPEMIPLKFGTSYILDPASYKAELTQTLTYGPDFRPDRLGGLLDNSPRNPTRGQSGCGLVNLRTAILFKSWKDYNTL